MIICTSWRKLLLILGFVLSLCSEIIQPAVLPAHAKSREFTTWSASYTLLGFGAFGLTACISLAAWRIFPYLCSAQGQDARAIQQLGYDPEVSALPHATPERNVAVIYAHGFHGSKMKVESTNSYVSVSFNFPDYATSGSEDIPYVRFRQINLGQELDMRVLLYSLICCYEAGYTTIFGLGLSRAGAAWIRALDALTNPVLYIKTWKKLGVVTSTGALDLIKINALKNAVERGCIVLAQPLLDVHVALKKMVKKRFEYYVSALLPSLERWVVPVGHVVLECGLASVTNYNPIESSPFELLKTMMYSAEQPAFKIHIFVRDRDSVVGNCYDDLLEHMGMECTGPMVVSVQKNASFANEKENHRDMSLALLDLEEMLHRQVTGEQTPPLPDCKSLIY